MIASFNPTQLIARSAARATPVQGLRNNSGSFAMLAAILLASSFVSNFAADRRSGSFE
jgi:hypothetical protein